MIERNHQLELDRDAEVNFDSDEEAKIASNSVNHRSSTRDGGSKEDT